MTSLFPVACHDPRTPSLSPPEPPLPLRSPFTEGRCRVAEVQNLTRYKHVTGYSEGVEAVTLVHNHYHVPHVALHEVDPEVGVHRLPPLASPLNGQHRLPHHTTGFIWYPSLERPGPSGVQWGDARGGRRCTPTSGSTPCNATCGTW